MSNHEIDALELAEVTDFGPEVEPDEVFVPAPPRLRNVWDSTGYDHTDRSLDPLEY